MNALLTGLMLWIAANSFLAPTPRLPHVVQMDPVELACIMEYIDPCDESKLDKTQVWYAYYRPPFGQDPGLIVVSDDVNLDSVAGHSVLLHEMVHHMQAAEGQDYDIECHAYKLEDKWLHERGSSLQEAFGLEDLYVLLSKICYIL